MEWFRRLFKPAPAKESDDEMGERLLATLNDGRDKIDHLGIAAEIAQKSQRAIKNGRYDEAWGLIHDQKTHYLLHAQKYGFTARQTLAIDGSTHLPLANIRRLEGDHDDAIVHILYCDMTDDRKTKSMAKLLRAYFNRCRFQKTTLDEAIAFVEQLRPYPDYRSIQLKVAEWRSRESA